MIYKVSQKNKDKLETLDYIAIEYGFEVNTEQDIVKIVDIISNELGLSGYKLGKLSGIGSSLPRCWKLGLALPSISKFKKLLDYYISEVEKKKNESE